MVFTLAPRLGYHAVLWDIPLEVIYAMEHVELWKNGANTQKAINGDEFVQRIKKLRENYDAESR